MFKDKKMSKGASQMLIVNKQETGKPAFTTQRYNQPVTFFYPKNSPDMQAEKSN